MTEPGGRRAPEAWTTLLFVPGDRPEMLAKAQTRGADAIVADLEDAVAPDQKERARRAVRDAAAEGGLAGDATVCVRINAIGEGADEDIGALAGAPIDAVMIPKAASAEELRHVRAVLDASSPRGPQIELIPQVESAAGVLCLGEIVRATRLGAVAFGGEDFCVDLGVSRSAGSLELMLPRALVALHARAAGLGAIDTVYTAIDDESGLIAEAQTARQLGFSGKLLIHPGQIDPVRAVFAPSSADVAWARRVVDAGALDGAGRGAGVRLVDGKMIDAPVMAQARRILARSGNA